METGNEYTAGEGTYVYDLAHAGRDSGCSLGCGCDDECGYSVDAGVGDDGKAENDVDINGRVEGIERAFAAHAVSEAALPASRVMHA